MHIEKYREDINHCVRCASCRESIRLGTTKEGVYKVCPAWELKGFEAYCARGRILLAKSLLEGRMDFNAPFVESAFSCLTCGSCKEVCPLQLDIPEIIRALRHDIFDEGLGPPKPLKRINLNIHQKRNIFGEDPSKRSEWAKELHLSDGSDVIYFAGCYDSYRFPKTSRAAVSILREGGVDVAILKDEWCCGLPPLYNGNTALSEEMVKHNFETMKSIGAAKVITSCAGCYHVIKTEYPKIVGRLPFEVLHISEIIEDMIKTGKVRLENKITKTVTYHDPCHLGRGEKIYEPPRNVLAAIDGLKTVEMLRNKEHAWCCGGGAGSFYVCFTDLAAKVADERLAEAIDAGAKSIVTTCPMCVTTLKLSARKARIEVENLPVIVAQAMGMEI